MGRKQIKSGDFSFISNSQREELHALVARHHNLVRKVNHPYALLLSLGMPAFLIYLMLTPDNPLFSVVQGWYQALFQEQMQGYSASLSWYDAQEVTVRNSVETMNTFCDNLVTEIVSLCRKHGHAFLIVDGVLKQASLRVVASYNITTVLAILDKKLGPEAMSHYKTVFITHLLDFLPYANAFELSVTSLSPEFSAKVVDSISSKIVLPANLMDLSLSDLYKLVKSMNKRLDLYNRLSKAYEPMKKEALDNAMTWAADYYAWERTVRYLSHMRIVGVVSSYFLFSERLIRRYFPDGILQRGRTPRFSDNTLNQMTFLQAERSIHTLKEACAELAPAANRNDFIARTLLFFTLFMNLSFFSEDLSIEAWCCLATFAGFVSIRSLTSAREWWTEYRYEDTLAACQAEVERVFETFSQPTEVIYDYNDINVAKVLVRFKPYKNLTARAVSKVMINVFVAHGLEGITRIDSYGVSLPVQDSLPNSLILRLRQDIGRALEQECQAKSVKKQCEDLRLLDAFSQFGFMIRPMLVEGFLKYLEISFVLPIDAEERLVQLFTHFPSCKVSLEKQVNVLLVSLDLFECLPDAFAGELLRLLQTLKVQPCIPGLPTITNIAPLRLPTKPVGKKHQTDEENILPPPNEAEQEPVVRIEWPSGTYQSDQQCDIVPIRTGQNMRHGHYVLFKCKPEDFPTEEMYLKYKELILRDPKIAPAKGHNGLKLVASTERLKAGKFFNASLKAKHLGCGAYRLLAYAEKAPNGGTLHVFGPGAVFKK